MKILIVSTSDTQGGASKAAYRLHKALLKAEIDSLMLVQDKRTDEHTIIGPETKIQKSFAKIRPYLDQLPLKKYKNRTQTLFSPAWLPFSGIIDKINKVNPDIVHLHWICNGLMRIEDIAEIKTPIVWSLHDMWAFTGGCHYDEGCGFYTKECGYCKVLGSNNKNDLSMKAFKRKQKTFTRKKDITIIGLSNWLLNCSKSSTLLSSKNHINLPNPIDTNFFKIIDKKVSRRLWNLPDNKKLILFGAISADSDPRKGFEKLRESLQKLEDKNSIELVVFGSSELKSSQNFGFNTHCLEYLHDDASLITLYNAVDVIVVPSLQENLSNIIMESLSCGLPVVAFNIGGNNDIIEHKQNGYLAKPFECEDLAHGIEWILNNPNCNELSRNAREKIVKEFDSAIVAKKYIKLYEKIIKHIR
jgi:glycosyltransferase involved in cell wall biosynthesis